MTTLTNPMNKTADEIADMFALVLIPELNLAIRMGYEPTEKGISELKLWTSKVGIRQAPRRRGFYDPKHVREKLDAYYAPKPANGVPATVDEPLTVPEEPTLSHVELRHMRKKNG